MRIIEQLVYKITGDNSEFDKSITQSEGKVNKFGSVADKMLAGVTVAAVTMVIKKVGDMVVATAQATDRVDKMSQKIGISRKAFQEWDFILSQSGTSVDGLQMAVKTLSGAADEASKGTLQYKESFDRLGVSVTDTNGKMKDQETLFAEVFSALADMENQTERTALASDLLGRSATELGPAFNAGGDAIEDMRVKAHELGLVMDDELIDNGVVLTDNIDKLKRAYKGWKNEALEPLLGLAVTFTEKLLGHDSASKQLTTSTNNLASATDAFKTITSQLKNPIDNLTESEKALLEIQQKRAEIKLNQAVIELGKNYADTQRTISNLKNDEEKYQNTIEQSLAVINSYTPQQREEIRNYVQQGRAVTDMTLKKRELLTAEDDLKRAQVGLLSTQAKLIDENGNFNASITQIAQGVIDQQVELSTLANINAEFAESVRDQVDAIKEEKQATLDATEAFKEYSTWSDVMIAGKIAELEMGERSLAGEKLLQMLYQKRNEILAVSAQKSAELSEKEQARIDILNNTNSAIASAEQYSLALGDSYDLNSQKASILESAIKSLIDSGLNAESEEVKNLKAQLLALTPATEEVVVAVEAVTEAIVENTNVIPDAQKAFNDYKTVIDNLRASLKQAEEFEKLYGDQFDLNAEKASILKGAIDSLIKLGFNASSTAVQELVTQLEALGDTTTKVANTNIIPAAQVAFNTWRAEQERTKKEE